MPFGQHVRRWGKRGKLVRKALGQEIVGVKNDNESDRGALEAGNSLGAESRNPD